jgi:hypothetical protein
MNLEALKTWRKANVAMILSTQSLDELRPLDLLEVIIECRPNKIPIPDLRIEYETREGDAARVNLELVTEHYRGRHVADKVHVARRGRSPSSNPRSTRTDRGDSFPMKIPNEHLRAIQSLGYTADEARFLYVVATHSGYFLPRQFQDRKYFETEHDKVHFFCDER